MKTEEEKHRHHAGYVSHQDVIHKCLLTYWNLSHNMSFQWYVMNIHDSTNRKGYTISKEEVESTLAHFLKGKIDFCPHCFK